MSTNQTKKCSKCSEVKELSEFHKSTRDGYKSKCKICRKQENIKNKIYNRLYQYNYRKENKDILNKRQSNYYKNNSDMLKGKSKNYRKNNKEKCRKRDYEYQKTRRKNDLGYKMTCDLRSIIGNRIKHQGGKKAYKSIELLGCSIDMVRFHLECQFTEGMTWENHSIHGWHIDHIRPCASFDLTDPKQQKECFHYSNLQPLWAEDNLSKGDKW